MRLSESKINTIGSQTKHQRKIMNVGKEPVVRRWGTEERPRDDGGCITFMRVHLLLVELGFFLSFHNIFTGYLGILHHES